MAAPGKLTCSACGRRFATPPAGAEATCPGCGATTPLTALATRVGATSAPDAGLLGTTVAGFKLVEFLGAGGMGLVFAAERTDAAELTSPSTVAIKLLAKELADNPDFVARFSRESSALAKIEHDNLIRVYGAGAAGSEGPYFYLMERFEGGDLQDLLRSGLPTVEQARAILLGAAAGLTHAHDAGIVHRDIKPGNILVSGNVEEGGAVKVVDFGVAQWAPIEQRLTSLTRSDHLLGTLNYMAPEQRQAATSVDGRADVYALAVVAYEMLTGRLPLGVFERPSQLRPELPRKIDAVLWAALHRDPARRTASMKAFAQGIERALAPPKRRTWAAAALLAATVGGLAVAGAFVDSGGKSAKEAKTSVAPKPVQKAEVKTVTKTKQPEPLPPEAVKAADTMLAEAERLQRLAANLRAPPPLPKTTKASGKRKPTPKRRSFKKKSPKKSSLSTKEASIDRKNAFKDRAIGEADAPNEAAAD